MSLASNDHKGTAGLRFVIERPRLIQQIAESDARIVLLLAPAGYGKTTLARQWLHPGAHWFRASASSADVAALSAGLARTLARVAPGIEEALRQHLLTTEKPTDHAEALAGTMATELASWADDTWLVIEDYEYITGSNAAEAFVQHLLELSPIRAVVVSRRRPYWATARRILYGDIYEVLQDALAFTKVETELVLPGIGHAAAEEIWARAKGWPAAIRLAALSGRFAIPEDALPPALHQYFAEELYRAASLDSQMGLLRIATLPTLTTNLLEAVLGDTRKEICDEAVELGFLSPDSEEQLELHPLLRTFLDSKLRHEDQGFLPNLVGRVIASSQWDDAFTMVERFALLDSLAPLLEAAMDQLLQERRLVTLERWVRFAVERGCDFPLLLLAEAEIARRRGKFDIGEAHACQAANAFADVASPWVSRAYALAGECAHHDYRPSDAIRHQRLSELHAQTERDSSRAVWGQFLSTTQHEGKDGKELLDRLEQLSDGKPTMTLRIAVGRMILAVHEGDVEDILRRQEPYMHLVDRADDPLVTTSFLYRIAFMNVSTAHYSRALVIARKADDEAHKSTLPFALAHIAAALAASTIGLRHFGLADMHVRRMEAMATDVGDSFEVANAQALRARIQIAEGQLSDAAATLRHWQAAPTAALRGERGALRAIALAALGEFDEAQELTAYVRKTTHELQPTTLAIMASAIASLNSVSDSKHPLDAVDENLRSRQNYDDFVCAYRAFPLLLKAVRDQHFLEEHRLEAIVGEARDQKLAHALGWIIPKSRVSPAALTSREGEVYDLLCQGLTNREIAERLVIAEVTVKVHVRHILGKLGVRSRTQAALRLYEAE